MIEITKVHADTIVVLGCKVQPDGSPSAALQRRIALAARAFRAGVAPLVVASGGRRGAGHAEALAMRRSLLRAGVADDALVMELCSLSTRDNGAYCSALLRERGLDSAFIATCPWHFPRASRQFLRHGIRPVRPPDAWLVRVPVTPWLRLRESVSSWADSCMMAPRNGS